MLNRLIRFSLLIVTLQALFPVRSALADTGPKPSMEFMFEQELRGDVLTVTSGVLYECEQPDCSDAAPIEEVGPQGFYCETRSCRAMAYGFHPYHYIEIQFSDGVTRASNVFETAGFDSRYHVTIRPEDLLVEAQLTLGIFPRTGILLLACVCALAVLTGLVGVIVLRRRSARA